MIEAEFLRQQLVVSPKFGNLVKDLDVMKMAKADTIDLESLTDEEQNDEEKKK